MTEIPPRKRKKKQQVPAAAAHNERVHAEKQIERNKALQLRRAGMTYPQIAQQMGVAVATAFAYVKDALAAIPRENAKELLQIELEKCDRSELETQTMLQRKDLKPADFARLQQVLVKVREQRAKYMGLYAASQHEVSIVGQVNASSVREMTDEQLDRIASGDFSVLANGAGGYRAGDGGAGASPPKGTA